MMTNIIEIDINRLHGHPNNPRKDLGDLRELSESIKVSGILQNLTVVPKGDGDYVVLIGHRRMAAAKLAGLSSVPCSVVFMDEKEQVATMMIENMHRADLTLIEQADGFQFMMDLGYSVKDISAKTGFSDTTVRRRIKLCELDRNKLSEAVLRSGTLDDFAALNKIENLDVRNEVLESVGTSNFKWKLQQALDREKREEEKLGIIEQVSKFATKVSDTSGLVYVTSINSLQGFRPPCDEGSYYFTVNNYGICLYQECIDQDKEDITENQLMVELRESFSEITQRAFTLRLEFVKNFSAFKKYSVEIMSYAARRLRDASYYGGFGVNAFSFLTGTELVDGCISPEAFEEVLSKEPEKTLYACCISAFNDGTHRRYCDSWDCTHHPNTVLDTFYDFLISLGYEMSDEEKALRDGTHTLFTVKERKEL